MKRILLEFLRDILAAKRRQTREEMVLRSLIYV